MNSLIVEIIGWLGSLFIFSGLYGVSQKRRGAFLLSVAGESLWVVKSLYLHAWDLLTMTVAFLILAAYSYYKWGADEKDEARQTQDRVRQAQEAAHKRHIDMLRRESTPVSQYTPAQRKAYLEYINHERAALGQPPL